jgi:hypothetical protein
MLKKVKLFLKDFLISYELLVHALLMSRNRGKGKKGKGWAETVLPVVQLPPLEIRRQLFFIFLKDLRFFSELLVET